MSELDFSPTSSFAIWADAFSPAELDQIEAIGDRLGADPATVAAATSEGDVRADIRITRTSWLVPAPETKWI